MESISWTDRVKNGRSVTKSRGGDEYPTYSKKRKRTNCIGHILHRNFLLKTLLKENTGMDRSDAKAGKKA
jgi:hypothetical protein